MTARVCTSCGLMGCKLHPARVGDIAPGDRTVGAPRADTPRQRKDDHPTSFRLDAETGRLMGAIGVRLAVGRMAVFKLAIRDLALRLGVE